MDVVPGGSRLVTAVTEPPDRVYGPNPAVPVAVVAINDTSPAEPAGATVTVTLKFCPETFVAPLGLDKLVVVAVRVNVLQLFSRLVTLTEPSPVAKSYPVAVANAGVVKFWNISIPNPDAAVLLQFGLPARHATELFPLVTSLNMHVPAGVFPTDALH